MNQQTFNPEEFVDALQELEVEPRHFRRMRPYDICIDQEFGKLEVVMCDHPEHWTVDDITNADRLFHHNLCLIDHFMSDAITCDYDLGICDDELVFHELEEESSNALSIGERLILARAEFVEAIERLKSLKWKMESNVGISSWQEDGF